MLESLGLDKLTEKVYRLLLTRHDLDVDEIAQTLDVEIDQVRAALDHLAELALLRPSWDLPGGFRPVSPEAGLQTLLQQRQAELARQQQQIAQAQSTIADLIDEYANHRLGSQTSSIGTLIGMDAIQARIEELSVRARIEIVSFMSHRAHDPRALEIAKPLDLRVLGNGVAMRSVFLESARHDPSTMAYAQWLAENGAEIRTAPTLPVRMTIYDRLTALLPLEAANPRKGVVQVFDTGVLTAVLSLFETIWDAATPIGIPPPRDDAGLSPRERQLLKLLAAGFTDEGAGRQMGLSQRTVRRMMADIMEQLGARSRFEAGLRAAERGWL
ncbi:helix-turn-helix domain-containing protein [Sphaerimonospora thailandensis]|uniref:HTH luxR-type domain-containing protein n=1 Tax=Sphaerimonospora thailandensis TaxID=795644 RepID=A0A8J3W019_9ACTN|nr:helix-turn-helix transcriptional regulator [Sphaerimonospora thailandensis]GIH71779.1 hypothetical protein Mth01_40320 [Sphaerimonospora thailandensis]